MHRAIVDGTNSVVGKDDRLIYLGDCTFGFNKLDTFKRLWSEIKCRNTVYIRGNHDGWMDKPGIMPEVEKIVGKVYDTYEEVIDGYPFWFCHYPYEEWIAYGGKRPKISEKAEGRQKEFPAVEYPPNKILINGHSHASKPDNPNTLTLDVSFEGEYFNHKKYTPYSIPEILHIMRTFKTPPLRG